MLDMTEINEAIKKQLPSQVGEELNKLLVEGKNNKVKVGNLEGVLAARDKENAELRLELENTKLKLNKFYDREKSLKEREEAALGLKHREEINNIRLTCAQNEVALMDRILGTVFKSPVYKEEIINNKTIPFKYTPYPGGNEQISHQNEMETRNITKKEE